MLAAKEKDDFLDQWKQRKSSENNDIVSNTISAKKRVEKRHANIGMVKKTASLPLQHQPQ